MSTNLNDDLAWRTYVAETLGELKADMKSLVGNGRPGRVGALEATVSKHDQMIYYASGIAAVLSVIASAIVSYFL